MEGSESEVTMPTNVIEAIAKIIEELPGIAKVRHPSPGGKGVSYPYRGIEEITAELQSLMATYKVVIVPEVESIEVKDIIVNGNPWTDTRTTTRWHIYGPGGIDDVIHGRTAGIGRDNSDKGANKAASQCFKYLLLPMFMVSDPADDTDGTTDEADSAKASEATQSSGSTTRVRAPAGTGDKPPTMRKLFAIMNGNHTIPKDDDGRHGWAGKVLSRTVDTFKDLSSEDIKLLEKAAKEQVTDSEPEYPPGQEPF